MLKKALLVSFFILLPIAKINGMDQPDLEKAPILPRNNKSLITTDVTSGERALQSRRQTLWNAISMRDVELAKSSLAKDFDWVNTLYMHQSFNNNQITATRHEQEKHKLQFTRELFAEIDAAIAKEEARQKWLAMLSAPGAMTISCFPREARCIKINDGNPLALSINAGLSVLAAMIITLYCATHRPCWPSLVDTCGILPEDQRAQMFLNCTQSSRSQGIPCKIFNPHNETQIKMMENCCNNLVDMFYMAQFDEYKSQVYPRLLRREWMPGIVVLPSIVALQVAFQAGGYFYRRSKRLLEPIKQLLEQKKNDLNRAETEFNKLAIVDGSEF